MDLTGQIIVSMPNMVDFPEPVEPIRKANSFGLI